MKNPIWTLSALATAATLTLTSCSEGGSESTASESPQTEAAQAEAKEDARIQSSQDDMWARATDSEMTSVFGTIENLTDQDLTVVGASSEVAGITELHEIVEEDGRQIMQEIEDGFIIPASGSLELQAGGDHLMLMDLQQELLPGEVFDISLEFEDGTQESIKAMVRDDGGQDEPYEHGGDMDPMDHGNGSEGDGPASHGDASGHERDHESDDHER
ncbi:copper chaperone PCu(A)C [Nesterenkonia sp. LB17]|uniref:copper chaperone PCu(A)C n=1 Tax=Nesterenkonia sp. LB17 TaxID=2901230 RepID=UPI001F4CDCC3|nr:copper chaperone PCu(A)C [Nesterenkonia sp. LB17]MCH8566236.1 copper chaperone PCu(A)C [Nesterenkonia sp. LB17]